MKLISDYPEWKAVFPRFGYFAMGKVRKMLKDFSWIWPDRDFL